MGTDITFVVEHRTETGWARAEELVEVNGRTVREDWFDTRNSELFWVLAGVPSPRPVSENAIVAAARGLPVDASDETLAVVYGGAFSHSWLTAAELVAFDWHQPVHRTFDLTKRDAKFNPLPDEMTPTAVEEAAAHIAAKGFPPEGWTVAGKARDGVTVTVATPLSTMIGREFPAVIDRMVALAPDNPEQVRCIFWFDR